MSRDTKKEVQLNDMIRRLNRLRKMTEEMLHPRVTKRDVNTKIAKLWMRWKKTGVLLGRRRDLERTFSIKTAPRTTLLLSFMRAIYPEGTDRRLISREAAHVQKLIERFEKG